MLRIQTESGETLFQATADIHWTHPMAGGTSAGLYLNETLPEELLAWPEWDRRESLRYSLDIAARVWWKESRSSVPARIINYSSSGLGVICPEQVTLGSRAQIIAGRTLEDIVCVSAVPCWQVQTREGVTIGFELESMEGKRFGGYARQRWISPSASHISTQTQIVS
jgi:hypothetical protein